MMLFPISGSLFCTRRWLFVTTILSVGLRVSFVSPLLVADEPPAAEAASDSKSGDVPATEDKATEDKATEDTAIEVPDGTPKELFDFIASTMQNRGRDLESVKKAARAVVDAAAKIRTIDSVSLEDEIKAIGQQLPALEFLARMDKQAKVELEELVDALAQDERPAIRRVALFEKMKSEIAVAHRGSEDDQRALIARFTELIDSEGLDSQSLQIASMLGRSLGASENSELAATFHEDMADRLSKSDDERLREHAEKMLGTARRLRLPGNMMEVFGTLADGETLDWGSYRGKVVLVDYWASWCGPCRGEVPNMKRNLEKYGDRGFTILGINMDNTREAFEKYIEQEQIPWANLVSTNDEGKGWDHPMTVHYGVSGIPTAILVDREGKVVSLSARGARLDALLTELIGDVEPPE